MSSLGAGSENHALTPHPQVLVFAAQLRFSSGASCVRPPFIRFACGQLAPSEPGVPGLEVATSFEFSLESFSRICNNAYCHLTQLQLAAVGAAGIDSSGLIPYSLSTLMVPRLSSMVTTHSYEPASSSHIHRMSGPSISLTPPMAVPVQIPQPSSRVFHHASCAVPAECGALGRPTFFELAAARRRRR